MSHAKRRHPQARTLRLSPRLAPAPDTFDRLPDHLRDLISPVDPDFHVICDSIELMRIAGFDVTTEVGLRTCIESGRRRALELAVQGSPEARALQRGHAEEIRADLSCELERRSLVYYVKTGDLVKIGYTTNLARRMSDLSPDELLATEMGGPKREYARHQQFIALWSHGEWFRHEGELAEHVAELSLHGVPVSREAPKPPSYSNGRRLTTVEAAHLAGVVPATIRGWGSKPKIPVTRYADGWDMEEILSYRNIRRCCRPRLIDWAS